MSNFFKKISQNINKKKAMKQNKQHLLNQLRDLMMICLSFVKFAIGGEKTHFE